MPHVDHTLSNEDTEIPQVRRKLQTKEPRPLLSHVTQHVLAIENDVLFNDMEVCYMNRCRKDRESHTV